jgi:hypothetical protein
MSAKKKTPPKKQQAPAPVRDLPKLPSEHEKLIKGGAKRRFGESSE